MTAALPLAALALLADLPRQDVRVAVVVGNNHGLDSEQPLAWAEEDARRVHALLLEVGGVAPRRAYLVVGGGPEDVLRAISEATGQIRELSGYTRTALVFYVSAHADEESLHLGGERLPLARIREEVGHTEAQLRLVLVDACRVPVEVRWKGGRPGPEVPVVFDQSVRVAGEVLIAAAGPGELAQEWAHLRGSLFTHHLLAGLRGAADFDGNGRVTLTEAYSYAYRVTLAKAAEAGLAPQRPSFDFALAGFGDWVFTNTSAAGAQLALAEDLDGRIWITDRRSDIVAELEKRRGERLRLALAPGHYRVVVPAGARAWAADVGLGFGGTRTVGTSDLVRVETSRALGKGGAPLVVRPWDVDAAYAMSNGTLAGMSPRQVVEAGVARVMGDWVARVALGYGTASIDGPQVQVQHQELRLSGSMRWATEAGPATLGFGGELRPAWVWQRIARRDAGQLPAVFGAGTETASGLSMALGPLVSVSLPLAERWRLAFDIGGGIEWLPRLDGGVEVGYYVQPRLGVGWSY
ncbi:MAG TPA: hypothetical protein VFR85_01485 [Anaeromyxobacteraceae bacterium]|nr:hypothetical protein [Anaeromyxobacteraceae bacterium]